MESITQMGICKHETKIRWKDQSLQCMNCGKTFPWYWGSVQDPNYRKQNNVS